MNVKTEHAQKDKIQKMNGSYFARVRTSANKTLSDIMEDPRRVFFWQFMDVVIIFLIAVAVTSTAPAWLSNHFDFKIPIIMYFAFVLAAAFSLASIAFEIVDKQHLKRLFVSATVAMSFVFLYNALLTDIERDSDQSSNEFVDTDIKRDIKKSEKSNSELEEKIKMLQTQIQDTRKLNYLLVDKLKELELQMKDLEENKSK